MSDLGTPRKCRKIITRVIVFLLLGAIVNVAVSWGLALFPQTIVSYKYSPLPTMAQGWLRPMPPQVPQPTIGTAFSPNFVGETITCLLAPDQLDSQGAADVIYVQKIHAFGIPWRSIEYEIESTVNQRNRGIERVALKGSVTRN